MNYFVADGYFGNRRVIVFDADSGAYKRYRALYGNKPDDAAPKVPRYEGPGDLQFNQVHHVRISRDGSVYVADRLNRRIQIFRIDGAFVKEVFVRRDSKETAGTVSSLGIFSRPAAEVSVRGGSGGKRNSHLGSPDTTRTRVSGTSGTLRRAVCFAAQHNH